MSDEQVQDPNQVPATAISPASIAQVLNEIVQLEPQFQPVAVELVALTGNQVLITAVNNLPTFLPLLTKLAAILNPPPAAQ